MTLRNVVEDKGLTLYDYSYDKDISTVRKRVKNTTSSMSIHMNLFSMLKGNETMRSQGKYIWERFRGTTNTGYNNDTIVRKYPVEYKLYKVSYIFQTFCRTINTYKYRKLKYYKIKYYYDRES